MRFIVIVLLTLISSLSYAKPFGDHDALCAYFGASYEHSNAAPNVLAYQPIGYYLPGFLAPAGIGLINYSIPGASAQQLIQQYEQFLVSDNDPDRAVKTECLIIGVTGMALREPEAVYQWALRVATENKHRVVIALSYPRTDIYAANILDGLNVPENWNAMADYYDAALAWAGAQVIGPFVRSKPRDCQSDCRDPAWTYDRFHLSNASSMAAAAAIASAVIIALEDS